VTGPRWEPSGAGEGRPAPRRGRRRALAAVVLAAWLTTVGWHVRREYFQPELTRLAEAALASLAPGSHFFSVTMEGVAIGLASSRLDTLPDGFLLEDLLTLELPALGQTGTAVARTRVSLTPALRMRDFAFTLDSEGGRFQSTGRVLGDTLLQVTVEAGGRPEEVGFRLSEPPVFAAALPIRVALGGGLQVGNRMRFQVFDPSTLSTRPVEIRVLEYDTLLVADSAAMEPGSLRWTAARFESVPAWRISEEFGGIRMESWIDGQGRIVRSSSPLGFALERTEYELARQAQEVGREAGARSAPDLILNTAIASNVELGAVEEHRELRFVLRGVELAGFELDGGRQELRGDTLVVRREEWGSLAPGYTLPYPRMDLRGALEPEPLIQSGDPRIVEEARRAVDWYGSWRHDPRDAALRLNRRVYQMLDKSVTFSVPSALQVLESRAGDCNEHTVLFVAMARALGLPARTAVGLVYLDGAFFYHAWPEVWLGEWVAMDPTFGQGPASAAHLRFVTGGLAQQVEIVRLIGQLRIEVLTPGSAEEE